MKPQKSKYAPPQIVLKALSEARLVRLDGEVFIVAGDTLFPLERADRYLGSLGIFAQRHVVNWAVFEVLRRSDIPCINGIVLGDNMLESKFGGSYAIWRHYEGRLYCHTVDGTWEWPEGQWPEGVWRWPHSVGVPVGKGSIDDLLNYLHTAGIRTGIERLLLPALFGPLLLGISDASIVLMGNPRSGKTTLAHALALLGSGGRWGVVPSGGAKKLLDYLTYQRVAFIDPAQRMRRSLQSLLLAKISSRPIETYLRGQKVRRRLEGGVVLCIEDVEKLRGPLFSKCTFVQLYDFVPVYDCYQDFRHDPEQLFSFFIECQAAARAGLIDLWRQAQTIDVEPDWTAGVRPYEWANLGYRMAMCLGVEKDFKRYVSLMQLDAIREME